MQVLNVDLLRCKLNKITPNEYVLLFYLYHKNFEEIEKLFGRKEALAIRAKLIGTKYILSDTNTKFVDTILSKKNVCALLGIREDDINFWEWYNEYPIRHGSRVFRAATPDSKKAQEHKRKYLSAIKTAEEHQVAIKATAAYVKKMRDTGKLPYLLNIETVLNGRYWEQWEVYLQDGSVSNWKTDVI